MTDTCSFSLPGTTTSVDPVTDWETQTPGASLYAGKCRLRMAGNVSGSTQRQVVVDYVAASNPTLSVPVSAPTLPVGAVGSITAVDPSDPAGHLRLGLRMRVTGRVLGTEMTAQRVTVEVVTG